MRTDHESRRIVTRMMRRWLETGIRRETVVSPCCSSTGPRWCIGYYMEDGYLGSGSEASMLMLIGLRTSRRGIAIKFEDDVRRWIVSRGVVRRCARINYELK